MLGLVLILTQFLDFFAFITSIKMTIKHFRAYKFCFWLKTFKSTHLTLYGSGGLLCSLYLPNLFQSSYSTILLLFCFSFLVIECRSEAFRNIQQGEALREATCKRQNKSKLHPPISPNHQDKAKPTQSVQSNIHEGRSQYLWPNPVFSLN